MRKQLQQLEEIRMSFKGQFERFGTKSGWKGAVEKTVLIVNVTDKNDKHMTSHVWFNFTKGFEALNLQPGDLVGFDARVKEYVKGYRGYREDVYKPVSIDYKLSHPTNMSKIAKDGAKAAGELF